MATEVIRYTYDGWDVIREDSSLKGVTTYQNGLGIDDKLRSKNGTTVRYFLTDHLGSTEALTDATVAVVSSTSYDSFGNATSNIATTYRYTGREYDSETGLYYYRNRWYDPEIGRFTSKDPIGFAGGDINLYGYVGSNPLSFVDPLGNYPCSSQNKRRAKFDEAVKAVKGILGKENACSRFFLGQGLAALKGIGDTVNSQEEDKEKKTFKSLGDNKTGIKMKPPVIISYGSYGSPASIEDLKRNGPSPIVLSPGVVSINTRGPFLSSWAKRTGGIRPNTLKCQDPCDYRLCARITLAFPSPIVPSFAPASNVPEHVALSAHCRPYNSHTM